jgi:hypothetical protein
MAACTNSANSAATGSASGIECRAAYEAKKRFLGDVFGGVHRASEAPGEAEHGDMMGFEELFKGFGIAVGGSREEVVFGFGFHRLTGIQ